MPWPQQWYVDALQTNFTKRAYNASPMPRFIKRYVDASPTSSTSTRIQCLPHAPFRTMAIQPVEKTGYKRHLHASLGKCPIVASIMGPYYTALGTRLSLLVWKNYVLTTDQLVFYTHLHSIFSKRVDISKSQMGSGLPGHSINLSRKHLIILSE
jgi:hypothetical protein